MPLYRETIGVGVDLVSWSRIRRLLSDHTVQFLSRLMSPSEQSAFQKTSDRVSFFARHFAAKEAYFKAQNSNWMAESDFRQIEVLEQGDQFRIQGDRRTGGRFFEIPGGIGAQVLIWG